MNYLILVVLVCIGELHGLLFGGSNKGPAWDTFRMTWGPNPLSSQYFVKQPLTLNEALNNGFIEIPGQCNGLFLGQRLVKKDDPAVILIYDKQGTIAGMQLAVPDVFISDTHYKFSTQKMFNRDQVLGIDAHLLTAYFVNPLTICSTGRDPSSLKHEGTGTGLWLQNGTDPIRDSIQIPLFESDLSPTKWDKGLCFPSMGKHYWYDNRADMNCDEIFPSFLLYNKGKLTGFGWTLIGKFEYTKRTEFPPLATVLAFRDPVPTCLKQKYQETGGFTTMHLYFNADTMNLLC
ncbi:unnamed protein product [Rotaria sordida]|uniref:Uncharacterized protein n=2 Tax=Rotaria sordida TaxID=392033 RepID=A0A814UKH1_9BILA|nr:unnamed protein product [Rotaria sordida]CAF1257327.1 unnamed protein product [Rotaria sordida]